ncbi:MAG: hypothetical protein LBH75_03920, partial [Treponema sp.]|nr:hypothetical protein [Treponema sp.]
MLGKLVQGVPSLFVGNFRFWRAKQMAHNIFFGVNSPSVLFLAESYVILLPPCGTRRKSTLGKFMKDHESPLGFEAPSNAIQPQGDEKEAAMSIAQTVLMVGVTLVVVTLLVLIFRLRRIVPSNMVHILQRSKSTVSYGVGMRAGNTYYKWP